jgi:hypothetical protein
LNSRRGGLGDAERAIVVTLKPSPCQPVLDCHACERPDVNAGLVGTRNLNADFAGNRCFRYWAASADELDGGLDVINLLHWLESFCFWRRRNHDSSMAIVDNYFAHPSFSAPHFFLAMPSSLTATRDSRDSPGAVEHETFFAILPLPASQSITTAPADHRF